MITPDEYIEIKPQVAWIHALDVLKHVLKGDHTETAYKDDDPSEKFFRELTKEMQKHSKVADDAFLEIQDECYMPVKKYKAFASDCDGEFDVDSFLDNDERCFREDLKVRSRKPALTLVFDMGIPYGERDGKEMEERHQIIYRMTMEAMSEGRPIRVIAASVCRIDEFYTNPFRLYMIVKDFSDPIFPGIWGALKNNKCTNSLANVIYDYLVGTHTSSNGYPEYWNAAKDLDEGDEVIVVRPKRVSYNPLEL